MKKVNQQAARDEMEMQYTPELRRQLKAELSARGCFKPAHRLQMAHGMVIVLLYAGGYGLLLTSPDIIVRLLALVVLAFSSVQAGYLAHEAGHGAVTRKRWLAIAIGQFFNTFLTALCYAHFQKIHVLHHTHCNHQDHDLDMQSGIFNLYPEARYQRKSPLGRVISRFQNYLIWPLVSLQGFSLKIDSIKTLRENPDSTRIDQLVLILHLMLWFGLPVYMLGFADAAINYLLMTWFIGPYLGSVFLINHIGTEVISGDDRIPGFLQRLITTRNLGGSRFADFYFGGMNNHIEHHLFPSIPTTRLRTARPVVQAFCQRHGLSYRKTNWRCAVRDVFRYLGDIARQPI
ncbi:MAG: acyl-CoA desaturase [Gammaproteobacteria bacterium]